MAKSTYQPTGSEVIEEVEQEAMEDLHEWLRNAGVSKYSILSIKKEFENHHFTPNQYWNSDLNCGCFKGLAYYHEFGGPPINDHEFRFAEDFISDAFDDAVVDSSTPFERWMIRSAEDNHEMTEEEAEYIADRVTFWLDEYIRLYM